MSEYLDPAVWGPHYWFFLHTIAMTYPHYPNAVTKKKFYDLFHDVNYVLLRISITIISLFPKTCTLF